MVASPVFFSSLSSLLGLSIELFSRRRWRLVTAQAVSCCVYENLKQRDSASRVVWQLDDTSLHLLLLKSSMICPWSSLAEGDDEQLDRPNSHEWAALFSWFAINTTAYNWGRFHFYYRAPWFGTYYFVSYLFVYVCVSQSISVIRFGETSPLGQNITIILTIFEGLILYLAQFLTNFGILGYWANFHCFKWPNNER